MRMSKGQGLFSSIAKGLNEFWAEAGMMIFFQLVEHKEEVLAKENKIKRLSEEELQTLEELLNLEISDVPTKLAFVIRTSDVDQTFEMQRQNLLALTQIYTQYATQTVDLSMMLFGPEGEQMKQMAPDAYAHNLSIYVGATKMLQEVFKFFGKEDPQQYVPAIKKQEFLLDMIDTMNENMVRSAKGLAPKESPVPQQGQPQGQMTGPQDGTGPGAGPDSLDDGGTIQGVM